MIATELLNEGLPVLSKNDTVLRALKLMKEFKVAHLPVVDGDEYLGLMAEPFLQTLSVKDTMEKHLGNLVRPFLFEDQHFFDALRLIDTFKISLVPVLGKNSNFLGSFEAV